MPSKKEEGKANQINQRSGQYQFATKLQWFFFYFCDMNFLVILRDTKTVNDLNFYVSENN
jgi:hypothetical protein